MEHKYLPPAVVNPGQVTCVTMLTEGNSDRGDNSPVVVIAIFTFIHDNEMTSYVISDYNAAGCWLLLLLILLLLPSETRAM